MTKPERRDEDNSQLNHAAGAVACLIVIPLTVELVGLAVLVGAFDMPPRSAALYLLAPALLLGVAGAYSRPVREFVSGAFQFLPW